MANASILLKLLEHYGLSVNRFEAEIKTTQSRIARAIDRDSVLKPDLIDKILTRYPEVSKHWLDTGQGKMIENTPSSIKPIPPKQGDYKKPETLYQKAIQGIKNAYDFLAYPTSKDLKEMADAVESIENLKEYYESKLSAEEIEKGELKKEIERLKKLHKDK